MQISCLACVCIVTTSGLSQRAGSLFSGPLDRFTMRVILEWPQERSGGSFKHDRRIAQLAEQLTLNQRVRGSSPRAPTNHFNDLTTGKAISALQFYFGLTLRLTFGYQNLRLGTLSLANRKRPARILPLYVMQILIQRKTFCASVLKGQSHSTTP